MDERDNKQRKQTIVVIKSFIFCVAPIKRFTSFYSFKYRVKYITKEQAIIQHNSMTAKQHFTKYADKKQDSSKS